MRIRSVFRSKSIAKNWFREIHHSVCGFLSFSSQTAGESKGEESVATALFAYYGQQKIVAGEKRETVEAQIKTLDNLKQLLGQLISDVANNLRVITNSEKRFDGVLPGTVISVDLETRRERLSIYRSILTTMKKNDIETQSEGAETADADWIVMRIGDLAMLHIMSPEIRSDVNLEIEKSDHENPESLIKAMRALERRSDSRV